MHLIPRVSITEVVEGPPESNTFLDWKYCTC